MPQFFLTIDATSSYVTDAPLLEILIDGSVVSSLSITSAYTPSTLSIDFSGNYPSSFSLRFNDGSAEGGRSISLHSVRINGIDADNANLSSLFLTQGNSSIIDTVTTDYLYGKRTPSNSEIGTPDITGTAVGDILNSLDSDDIVRGNDGADKINTTGGDDRILGDDGNDRIYAGDGNDIVQSGRDNDRVHGGNGDDLIYSHNDNDIVYGESGSDYINAGSGDDRAYGGSDNDILLGGNGNDLLNGGTGDDRLEGQGGNDRLYGEDGDDYIIGSAGFDKLVGGNGDDYLNGGNDNDRLYGDADNDFLTGGSGNDKLYGGDGDDDLRGGSGNDWLIGGDGVDDLRGGNGDDILFYDSQDEFRGNGGFDWIVLSQTETGNLDFSEARFRTGIEGIKLENHAGGAQANSLSLDIADILDNSDTNEIFVNGDIGLDDVTSTDFTLADRQASDVQRGASRYAHFNDGGADLYIEIGLDLNGTTLTAI